MTKPPNQAAESSRRIEFGAEGPAAARSAYADPQRVHGGARPAVGGRLSSGTATGIVITNSGNLAGLEKLMR